MKRIQHVRDRDKTTHIHIMYVHSFIIIILHSRMVGKDLKPLLTITQCNKNKIKCICLVLCVYLIWYICHSKECFQFDCKWSYAWYCWTTSNVVQDDHPLWKRFSTKWMVFWKRYKHYLQLILVRRLILLRKQEVITSKKIKKNNFDYWSLLMSWFS